MLASVTMTSIKTLPLLEGTRLIVVDEGAIMRYVKEMPMKNRVPFASRLENSFTHVHMCFRNRCDVQQKIDRGMDTNV